jgi:hypothetical protein
MNCPKDLPEIKRMFQDYADEFYHVLSAGKVFTRGIGLEEYHHFIAEMMDRYTNEVHENNKLFEIHMMLLPLYIVYQLTDFLHTASWDYEFGVGPFLDALSEMFSGGPVKLNWDYDETTGKLSISVDRAVWKGETESLDSEDFNLYEMIIDFTSRQLKEKGLTFIDVVTGDQTSLAIVSPLEAVPEITRFLIASDDQKRAEKVYRLLE